MSLFPTHEEQYEGRVITALRQAMRELGHIEWEEALDPETATFKSCEYVLIHVEEFGISAGALNWYDSFEDDREKFVEWVTMRFGPNWGKIAEMAEWR